MKAIWRFYLDMYYGSLWGIFVATESELNELVGKEIYYGEVNGKHSEVKEIFEMSQVEKLTDNPNAVAMFEKYNLETGVNPLDYEDQEE